MLIAQTGYIFMCGGYILAYNLVLTKPLLLPIFSRMEVENRMKTPIPPYSQTQLHSFISNCSTSSSNPSNVSEVGNRQSVKAHYCSSLSFLPHTFPLLQYWVPLMNKVLQDLHQHGVVFTVLHGLQFLKVESLLHYELFADCLFPQNLSIYSSVGSSIGCSVEYLLWHSSWSSGGNLLHYSLLYELQEILLCSSFPSFFTRLGVYKVISHYSNSSLLQLLHTVFKPLIYVIIMPSLALITGSVLARVGQFWSWLELTLSCMEQSLISSHKIQPCSLQSYQNLAT